MPSLPSMLMRHAASSIGRTNRSRVNWLAGSMFEISGDP